MKRFLALGLLVSLLGVTVAQDKDKTPPSKPQAATKPQDRDKPAAAQDKPATPPAPATTPAGNAEVELGWKFVKDQTYYQKLRTTTEQKMKVQQTTVDQKQEQEFVFSWKVEDVDASKVVLKQKIEAVMMKINIS